jgi:hypothetical protein
MPRRRSLIALLALSTTVTPAFGATYEEQKSSELKSCRAIDPSAFQSGLIFNPEGHRSFYLRSECFQRTAVRFRDPALCREVKERRSLFSSSWGYSPARCRALAVEGIAADRKTLQSIKDQYSRGAVRMLDFRVERNGNGRDFDFLPTFAGEYAHGHTLRFELIPAPGKSAVLLHSSGYYVDGTSNLRIFVTQEEIRRRFAEFALDRVYPVRATLILEIGNGNQGGLWSERFIEEVFPVRERSRSLQREISF